MSDTQRIVWFNEINKNHVPLVGGKGANLGEMTKAGFPIPFGFVVTSNTYFEVIKHNDLHREILNYVQLVNFDNPKELHDAAASIRRIIKNVEVPKSIVNEIHSYYHHLTLEEAKHYKKSKSEQVLKQLQSTVKAPLVAVRSSATAEDLPDASFAGQQETFLNVQGENSVVDMVKSCWASLFTERAMYYRHHQKYDHMKVGLAAVVQRMVQSDRSGIAFSIDPVTNNRKVITIEAIEGLGEYIVGGKVTPDHYEVSKEGYMIVKKEIKNQTIKLVKRGNGNAEYKLPKDHQDKQKLSDAKIVELAHIISKIEDHYGRPQDIEWAMEDSQLYIVQSRPVTTANKEKHEDNSKADTTGHKLLVTGSPASPGVGYGKPVIVMSPDEIHKVKQGDVLIAPMTDPDYVPAMKRASAIVTELGGRTSHAAIVSRELDVPAVVGAAGAIKAIKDEDIVTVNGSTGEVYSGKLHIKEDKKVDEDHDKANKLHTVTKIYVNLAEVSMAADVAKLHVDGIGLMRAEFMMAEIGVHPKKALADGKREEFISKIEDSLTKVVKPFSPRPVVYRATDFKTNEYRNLKGGEKYEPHEENPMLGFRGASRYIVWRDVFTMELEAIKRVRDKGHKNLHLMIPFVRTPLELLEIKSMLKEYGLENGSSFKLWIMVEVPSTVILLEEFIKLGIDGISIGTNDLTMLLLGVDRDNAEVAHIYDEQNPAVTWALERIVKLARKHNITVSVCGQAPSDYPDLAESLVKWGATSLSLNTDAVDRTRLLIHELEKKLWQK